MDDHVESGSRRVLIGSIVVSLLGITWGSGLIIIGSCLTWRSDRVLGLYSESGWSFNNLVHGDGRITIVLGIVIAVGMLLGVAFRSRIAYAVALATDLLVACVVIYELIFIASRQGVVSPGSGLYMALGATVAGGLCALSGYLMMTETMREAHEAAAAASA